MYVWMDGCMHARMYVYELISPVHTASPTVLNPGGGEKPSTNIQPGNVG